MYLQNLQLSAQIAQIKSLPTPTPTQAPTIDETENWLTYTNKKYGYSFKYPKEITEDINYFKLTDESVSFFGLDNLWFLFEPINTSSVDSSAWWKSQTVDPIHGEPKKCYSSAVENEVFENTLVLTNDSKSSDCMGPFTGEKIYIISNNKKLFKALALGPTGEKILSTFKFK